ncbi:pyridoxal phosphate-dependent aminotransferase [Pseudarthrobacter sp. Y6]|uniref:pyridoxal phosphate-dependent aminotransferase n=1 Tax=Pseudarthrobacter sp. Y6 TaxID=3418422 RepID=UPI003CF7CDA4
MVYVAGKSSESLARELGLESVIKLGSNESPLGPSKAAIAAVENAARQMHLYPGVEAGDLRADIAERAGVPVGSVVIGNGSSDVLLKVAAALLRGGGEAIIPEPCFSMYEVAVDWAGGSRIHVPGLDYRFDVAGIVSAITPQTRMIFLTNPNNPTGLPLSRQEIEFVLSSINSNITVILDEAYCEYVDPGDRVDGVDFFKAGHRIVVTRTFSKIHALAGMRVGYGIAAEELVSEITAHIPPFYSGSLGLKAARASLWDDEHLIRSRDVNDDGRKYLTAAFTAMGLRVLPSAANHVLIVEMANVDAVDRLMNERGFIGRPTGSSFGLPGGYRVTVGTAEQNRAFVTNLAAVLDSMAP